MYVLLYLTLVVFFFSGTGIGLCGQIVVPDDFPTISEALEAARFGDRVVVKPGTYYERIQMKQGVALTSWDGDGGNQLVKGPGRKMVLKRALRTVIDGSRLESPGYLLSFPKDTTAPMRFDGFTLRNLPMYRTGIKIFMVEIRGCSPEFVNNIVHGNKSWGGVLSTGLGTGMGPPLETTARPIIKDNVVYDNLGPGIANGPNSEGIVRDNEVFGHRFQGRRSGDQDPPGIGIREYARPLIQGNICYRNGSGIGAINLDAHEKTLIIKGNEVFENRRAGINLKALGEKQGKITVIVEQNQIHGNLKSGVMALNVCDITITSNVIYDNGRSGIAIYDSEKAIIRNNEIYRNMVAGIRLLDVPDVMVKGNSIYQNVTAGIDFIGWRPSGFLMPR